MKWQGRRGSNNVQDRRGMRGGVVGGGIGAIILTILALALGVDPEAIVPTGFTETAGPRTAAEDSAARMVSVVLADTEEVWQELFRTQVGQPYQEPPLILFNGSIDSACGFASAAVGPFYCPLDHSIYIDLTFFDDLQAQLGAPGDFAQAYVIAHEVGHHVQTLLGISDEVHAARSRQSSAEANEMSVRLELQADCFSGVWANRAQQQFQLLEAGDIEEALGAASAVGDDRLQRASRGGQIVPESFTHGTSEQRMRWFDRGFRSGDPETCDTFAVQNV